MKKMLITLILIIIGVTFYSPPIDVEAFTVDSTSYEFTRQEYDEYLSKYEYKTPNVDSIKINATDYIVREDNPLDLESIQFDGLENLVLYTPETGVVEWEVNVPTSGFYNMSIKYYPVLGKSSSIERSLFINGESPFKGAKNILFPRIWGNANEVKKDPNGNEIKPSQIEVSRWNEVNFRDDLGYVLEPYLFYFEEGINTVALDAIKEPMVIDYININSYQPLMNYEEVLKSNVDSGASDVSDVMIKIQGEDAIEKSTPTLYPISDRSSAITEPYHHSLIRLNSIGGYNWRVPGDSITWDFEVPEDGFYNVSLRLKQNFSRGMFASRAVYIDGEIPFKEMSSVPFKYKGKWQLETLGTESDDFKIYLTKGYHTISFEATLGEFSSLTKEVETAVANLNKIYREIIKFTGPTPDTYRDYQLVKRIPDLLDRLETESQRLQNVIKEMVEITGEKNERTAVLGRVIIQLDDFIKEPRSIHKRLKEFNNNLSALGTWILQIREQPLQIDYLLVHSVDSDLPKANEGFFLRLWHHIRSFIASFTTNYSAIGGGGQEGEQQIEVWTTLGRDQANVIRQLIDETFTPNTGIVVDLKLVNGGVLLPATLAGQGPDVAMNVGNTLPVNYALRNAIYDISQFDDFGEISKRFYSSAMVPYQLDDGYYALPEQQMFLMMFYRKDIFEELSLEVPDTWDDVIKIIPYLQKHHLDFWLPMHVTKGSMGDIQPNPLFASLLFQNDGNFYLDNDMRSGFMDEESLVAFSNWTKFYTAYKFPLQANFVNRFRNGEIPIGIEYYTAYNTLSVFAPEIRGEWEFAPIPGRVAIDENGNEYIRRETPAAGTAIVLMNNADDIDASWEYMKWWTSKDIQVKFGREMEGILGAAARYPTANVEALGELPWPTSDYEKLSEQWQYARGIPQIAGGYLTGRHLDNAFREVINNGTNAREAIYDYTLIINEEITKKRKEFGMPTYEETE